MLRLAKTSFFVGDRLRGPASDKRRSKTKHQSAYRRNALFYKHVTVHLRP